jgi:hypothetical protein
MALAPLATLLLPSALAGGLGVRAMAATAGGAQGGTTMSDETVVVYVTVPDRGVGG